MKRNLNEKEIKSLSIGYRLLKDNVDVFVEKYPCSRKIFKVYKKGVSEKEWSYSCFNLQELKGFFDGYFKGLNNCFSYERS